MNTFFTCLSKTIMNSDVPTLKSEKINSYRFNCSFKFFDENIKKDEEKKRKFIDT